MERKFTSKLRLKRTVMAVEGHFGPYPVAYLLALLSTAELWQKS